MINQAQRFQNKVKKQRQNLVYFLLFFLCLFCAEARAWNDEGHRVVAQIAFDQLSPIAKSHISSILLPDSKKRYLLREFLLAATWPDYIKRNNVHLYDEWHYINLPFSEDGSRLPLVNTPNVVWAIQKSEKVLASPQSSLAEKQLYLKFLIHFMGDIHQPLHCASRISHAFPNGDQGGNLFLIKHKEANNLHYYWDDAAGLFHHYVSGHISNRDIHYIAFQLENDYPANHFETATLQKSPTQIAQESFDLAKQYAYQTSPDARLKPQYQENAQVISEKQLVLAGYRLGFILNQIYGKP